MADTSTLPEFFSLSGKYLIAADASAADLVNDVACLLGCALDILDDERFEHRSEAEWGAIYLLRQARALHNEMQRRGVGHA